MVELQEKQVEASKLQPGSDAELTQFMKDRAMDRVIEGEDADTEMSYLEKVAPDEAQRLAKRENK